MLTTVPCMRFTNITIVIQESIHHIYAVTPKELVNVTMRDQCPISQKKKKSIED